MRDLRYDRAEVLRIRLMAILTKPPDPGCGCVKCFTLELCRCRTEWELGVLTEQHEQA